LKHTSKPVQQQWENKIMGPPYGGPF